VLASRAPPLLNRAAWDPVESGLPSRGRPLMAHRIGPTREVSLAKQRLVCDLEHDRPRGAVVRIEIKSTRASRPGHPMVRDAALCSAHAKQLRDMGLEIVRG